MKMDMQYLGKVYSDLVQGKYTVTKTASPSEAIGDVFTYAYAEYSGNAHEHYDAEAVEKDTMEAVYKTLEASLVKASVVEKGDARIQDIAKVIFDHAKADIGKGGVRLLLCKAFDETQIVVAAFCILNQ